MTGSAGNLGGIAINGCTTDWSYCSDIVQTDEAGNFSLVGLEPGAYILTVQTGTTYIWGFYQGPGLTQDFSAATPVDVTGGSVVLPDIELSTAFSISGVVTGSAGMLGELAVLGCAIDHRVLRLRDNRRGGQLHGARALAGHLPAHVREQRHDALRIRPLHGLRAQPTSSATGPRSPSPTAASSCRRSICRSV